MATSFNISQATELPVGIQQAPDSTPTRAKRINKVIPNQSWSMIQTLRFIQLQGQNLRDPSELGALISQTLTTAIDQGDSNTEKLNNLYTESETRRLDLELDPIDENLYKNQRDPRLTAGFATNLINNIGIETNLEDDLTYGSGALPEVEVSDSAVRVSWKTGTSPSSEEDTAIAIAEKLGLQVQHTSDELISLIIPIELSVDSTDPYVKKVRGQ